MGGMLSRPNEDSGGTIQNVDWPRKHGTLLRVRNQPLTAWAAPEIEELLVPFPRPNLGRLPEK
jgi:hypothetical protein